MKLYLVSGHGSETLSGCFCPIFAILHGERFVRLAAKEN
jgi:hypothetical protein